MIARKRLLPILIALLMVFAMMPISAGTAYASSGDPAMSLGTEVLDQNVNSTGAQTVWYADKTWRVIGYDGNGAASESGAATLLSAGNLDQTQYDGSGNYSNVYANSILRKKIEGADGMTGILDKFSESEQGAIKTRTLTHGAYNEEEPWNTDCIAGDEDLTAVLWPLSMKEANAVSSDLRWATSCWWLRSPGRNDYVTAFVDDYGDVDIIGFDVIREFGVRPAFNLNLESVLFTSAAESGKSSGAEGANALKAQSDQTNNGNEWKVTVTDDAHSGFAVSNVTAAENGVSVTYTGAATGTNEYISAIITDKPITDSSAKITHYGRVKNCTSASDTVTINTAGKLGTGDTLYVFNEQYNGDKKTDYASALQEVTIPEPQPAEQTITASNVTKTYGNAAFSLGAKTNGDGTLTYKSSNTKVATVSSAGKVTIKGAGTATITISASATANYKAASKTITVTVKQAANPLKISAKTASVKYNKLKKKTQTLAVTKVIKFTKKLNDKKTYTLVSVKKGGKSFKKYFKINKATGKVTIKKNSKMKKGTYKVNVKVKALGNANYKASGLKSVTFTVKVK